MITKGIIKTGEYFDSVTLMIVGRDLSAMDGVNDAAVVMGTKENKSILQTSGLLFPEFNNAKDTDLLIAVNARDEKTIEAALNMVEELLKKARNKGDDDEEFQPKSIDGALKIMPNANIAVISVAGKYAGAEAEKALNNGLHVMLFSDNVSIETELALKKKGASKGLLVMGPDCGTAIINGVPLAFANVVNRGDIGIVAAAGTGLQEVSSIISNAGGGISQAIGTGGRDIKKDIGGIMFIEGIKALANDPQTKVVCLVSKPPHKDVLEKIFQVIKQINKPVVSIFLGADSKPEIKNYYQASTLEEAALISVALSKNEKIEEVSNKLSLRKNEINLLAAKLRSKVGKDQRYIRALYSGGTFCSEAQVIFGKKITDIYSNAPYGNAKKLENSLESRAHTIVDLGEDEFTQGRPHPMIDFSLRNKRILAEGLDPQVAVILLDIVLGYGSNMDPAGEISSAIKAATKNKIIICSITGTDMDPQNRSIVENAVKKAGAVVMPSNAAACDLAKEIIAILK